MRLLIGGLAMVVLGTGLQAAPAGVRKVRDLVIYEDAKFYAAFPSIVQRRNGELLVAFRRAPERRPYDPSGVTHTDANSNLMLVRSKDRGQTWSTPQLMSVHPFGGSQDPCMVQLRDGTLLCASYAWAPLPKESIAKLKQPVFGTGNFAFLGGYLVKSRDGGKTWSDPIIPSPRKGEPNVDIFGKPIPAYNRGAMCEGRDGRLYWVVASGHTNAPSRTGTHLMISADKGETWQYSCVVAEDPKVQFNEASIYETPKGDLVVFLRTAGFNDHTCVARSTDRGRSFTWQDAGFQGHPHYALRLPDQRVLLVYGYRHKPFGIRARVLDAECTNAASAKEIVLREDGGNGDLGYPWAAMISKDRALVVYYFNQANGTRHIGGTEVIFDF
ncbi:MAG: sialidase family protein [Verrucomicrobiota bacterium]